MTRGKLLLLAAGLVLVTAVGFFVLRGTRSKDTPGDIIIQALQADSLSRPPARRSRIAPKPPDPSAIPELVRDTSWRTRLSAASALAEHPEIPAKRRAEMVLDALTQEVAMPAPAPPPAGSYLPLTGVIRLHYVHMIEDLGADAADPARTAMGQESGPAREWASIAFGASGAKDATPILRELLRSSSEADVRMSAAYFLGRLGDRSAVDDLKRALSDPATAQVNSKDSGRPRRTFYPVREQAAGALKNLGLKIQRTGDTFTAN